MAENKYNIGFNNFKEIYGEFGLRVIENLNQILPDIVNFII